MISEKWKKLRFERQVPSIEGANEMGGDKYVWVYITSWAMVWTLHAQGKTP